MTQPNPSLRVACDAMCGGLVRWLRVLGVDASYTPDIDDSALVGHALAEQRIVITGDTKLLERRVFTTARLRAVLVPVGLKLQRQVEHVVAALGVTATFPRCTRCNGELEAVAREEVGDIVPARSLIWVETFYRCRTCGHVYWEGTHWQRIRAVRERLGAKSD
jgi:hypothetical protein